MVGLYAAMHYYVVHTQSGLQVVRKAQPRTDVPYLDVRKFTPAQWTSFPEVAAAVRSIAADAQHRLADLSQSSAAWAADPEWK